MNSGEFRASIEKNGYNPKWFLEPTDKWICSICYCVCRAPLNLDCGHLFCDYCFRKSEKPICPLCKQAVDIKNLSIIWSIHYDIRRLSIRCPNDGCEKKGLTIGSDEKTIINHLDEECEKRVTPCPFCLSKIRYSEYSQHMSSECECRSVECQICHENIQFKDLEEHQNAATKCKNMVYCPSDSSEPHLIRIDDYDHLETCPDLIIPCSLCPYTCMRKDMPNHEKLMIEEHFVGLFERVKRTETEINQLKNKKRRLSYEDLQTGKPFYVGEKVKIKSAHGWKNAVVDNIESEAITFKYDERSCAHFPKNVAYDSNRIQRLVSLNDEFKVGDLVLRKDRDCAGVWYKHKIEGIQGDDFFYLSGLAFYRKKEELFKLTYPLLPNTPFYLQERVKILQDGLRKYADVVDMSDTQVTFKFLESSLYVLQRGQDISHIQRLPPSEIQNEEKKNDEELKVGDLVLRQDAYRTVDWYKHKILQIRGNEVLLNDFQSWRKKNGLVKLTNPLLPDTPFYFREVVSILHAGSWKGAAIAELRTHDIKFLLLCDQTDYVIPKSQAKDSNYVRRMYPVAN